MKKETVVFLVVLLATLAAFNPLVAEAFTLRFEMEKQKVVTETEAEKNNVSLNPVNIIISKEGEVVVEVVVSGAENVFGVGFDLNFNPLLLRFIRAEKGDFFSQDGATTWLAAKEASPGRLVFGLTRLGRERGGVSGDGIAARLVFKPLADGEGQLSFNGDKSALCVLKGNSHEFVKKDWGAAWVEITDKSEKKPIMIFNVGGKEDGR